VQGKQETDCNHGSSADLDDDERSVGGDLNSIKHTTQHAEVSGTGWKEALSIITEINLFLESTNLHFISNHCKYICPMYLLCCKSETHIQKYCEPSCQNMEVKT
jgi:hypothetical protein